MPGADSSAPGIGDTRLRGYFDEQVDDTIRTDSTRTRCAVDDEDEEPEPVAAPADEVEPVVGLLDEVPAVDPEPLEPGVLDSRRPRISTSWFTCWRSSVLSPSRM